VLLAVSHLPSALCKVISVAHWRRKMVRDGGCNQGAPPWSLPTSAFRWC
jgi:hypothetical protein